MVRVSRVGWLSGLACWLGLASACGGKLIVAPTDEGDVTSSAGAAPRGDAGGTANNTNPGGSGAAGPSTSGGSGIVVGENGWRWNLDCPRTLAEYCALDGAVCLTNWDEGSSVDDWCAHSNVTALSLAANCNGYDQVSVFGVDAIGGASEMFNVYYYDLTTKQLVHVDSNSVPSYTQCVAGESGTKLDGFGCQGAFVECR